MGRSLRTTPLTPHVTPLLHPLNIPAGVPVIPPCPPTVPHPPPPLKSPNIPPTAITTPRDSRNMSEVLCLSLCTTPLTPLFHSLLLCTQYPCVATLPVPQASRPRARRPPPSLLHALPCRCRPAPISLRNPGQTAPLAPVALNLVPNGAHTQPPIPLHCRTTSDTFGPSHMHKDGPCGTLANVPARPPDLEFQGASSMHTTTAEDAVQSAEKRARDNRSLGLYSAEVPFHVPGQGEWAGCTCHAEVTNSSCNGN